MEIYLIGWKSHTGGFGSFILRTENKGEFLYNEAASEARNYCNFGNPIVMYISKL